VTATPSGLVGRDQPLAELRALVAAALASRGDPERVEEARQGRDAIAHELAGGEAPTSP
jgi:hypothetical protein